MSLSVACRLFGSAIGHSRGRARLELPTARAPHPRSCAELLRCRQSESASPSRARVARLGARLARSGGEPRPQRASHTHKTHDSRTRLARVRREVLCHILGRTCPIPAPPKRPFLRVTPSPLLPSELPPRARGKRGKRAVVTSGQAEKKRPSPSELDEDSLEEDRRIRGPRRRARRLDRSHPRAPPRDGGRSGRAQRPPTAPRRPLLRPPPHAATSRPNRRRSTRTPPPRVVSSSWRTTPRFVR